MSFEDIKHRFSVLTHRWRPDSSAVSSEKDKIQLHIKNAMMPYRMAVDMEREMEISEGKYNDYRRQHLYYESSKLLQEAEDALFSELLPREDEYIRRTLGPISYGWKQTVSTTRHIRQTLIDNSVTPAIIDCRAKSDFSVWHKMRRHGIGIDEIFDLQGVRITTFDTTSAEHVVQVLKDNYKLMEPYQFRNGKGIHNPVRGSLDVPNDNGYTALHMNIAMPDGTAEIQVMTRQAFLQMHTDPDPLYIPARTIIGYK